MTVAPRHRPTQGQGRAGDGPRSGRFEVVEHRTDGAYRVLSLAAPGIAARARVGQFVEVGVAAPSTLLNRPFSIAAVDGGTVTVVYDVHGPGTAWLAGVDVHDMLDMIGPLGRPFPIPNRPVNPLLVAGGYGAAPLFWLAEDLRRAGMPVDMINGAATEGRLHGVIESKRQSASVVFTTDDGSFGTHGRVTDVLEERIEACGTGVVYAVGPMGMLRAVAQECARLEVTCQVSVEELMACGVGVCWTCVVPVRGEDGQVHHRRSCLDGPVFDGAAIAWEETRWAVGAPVVPEEEPPPPDRPTNRELFG
jgi:dihydroorotate dehydrogenase electron transfer subunit